MTPTTIAPAAARPERAGASIVSFHGGPAGAVAPLLVFLVAIALITARGMITIGAYFAPLVLAIALILLLARDRRAACDAMMDGVADRTVALMVFAFLGAGVLGRLLMASGTVQSLVALCNAAGVGGTAFVIAAFAAAALVATAIGTSTGTVVTCVPILFPAGVALGAHPALLLGAVYSGARFGDNIAPISDTTVASALTQGAEVGDVVRTRIKYAAAAALAAVALYLVAGSALQNEAAVAGQAVAETDAAYLPLAMLLAPALTVGLCLRRAPLIAALWAGIAGAVAIGLGTGVLTPSAIYSLEPPRQVGGAVYDGIVAMRDVIFLLFFIMAVLGVLRQSGVLEAVVRRVTPFATTPRRAELIMFVLVSALCPLCAGNTPAMLLSGPVVADIGRRFSIHPVRRANLMDLAGNGITESLPHINTMLALAGVMIATSELSGTPLVPLMSVGLLAFHPIMLTVVGLLAIATGWGAQRG